MPLHILQSLKQMLQMKGRSRYLSPCLSYLWGLLDIGISLHPCCISSLDNRPWAFSSWRSSIQTVNSWCTLFCCPVFLFLSAIPWTKQMDSILCSYSSLLFCPFLFWPWMYCSCWGCQQKALTGSGTKEEGRAIRQGKWQLYILEKSPFEFDISREQSAHFFNINLISTIHLETCLPKLS